MKILMFGWEFPPNISGGLGTACYGLTKSLSLLADVVITFVIPKVHGNENQNDIKLLGANQVDLIKSKIHREKLRVPVECFSVESLLVPYVEPEKFREQSARSVDKSGIRISHEKTKAIEFTGQYGSNLWSEIYNFSIISEYIACQSDFDLIHAHDWLTFPAGIMAKRSLGKPLVIHVHATDFDRSGGKVNPNVFQIEKMGMEQADSIVCVSDRTREMIIDNYNISPSKITTVHNGVEFACKDLILSKRIGAKEKIVTFMGRITLQKGPEYFIRVAELVLSKMNNVRFVMAGSGDQFYEMIKKVAKSGIGNRFAFTGFLNGEDVYRMMKLSDVYVMPSVSEPFGICPLEAMQFGVPTIISKQSGVSEVIKHTIKIDYWDVYAMADAIHGILSYNALNQMMTINGRKEAQSIKWEHAATKILKLYRRLISSSKQNENMLSVQV